MLLAKIHMAVVLAANTYSIDPSLLHAMIEVESSYRVSAVGSSHGEIGLMQLRPEFHPCASFDIEENIMCGAKYLATLKRLKGKEWGDAYFVAYNVGPNRDIKEPRKQTYYRKVKEAMKNGYYAKL